MQHCNYDEQASVIRVPRDRDDRAAIDGAERIGHAIAQAGRGGFANTGYARPSGAESSTAADWRTGAASFTSSCCHAAGTVSDTAGS